MSFLDTNDGLISGKFIIAVGKPQRWPHGIFYKITYQVGREAWETFASSEAVDDFLTEDQP